MNATMRFIVWGTIPLGTIAGGFLGGTIGLRETIWVGAIGSLFPFLPVLFSPVRTLITMPEPVGHGAATVGTIGDAVDETPLPARGTLGPDEA